MIVESRGIIIQQSRQCVWVVLISQIANFDAYSRILPWVVLSFWSWLAFCINSWAFLFSGGMCMFHASSAYTSFLSLIWLGVYMDLSQLQLFTAGECKFSLNSHKPSISDLFFQLFLTCLTCPFPPKYDFNVCSGGWVQGQLAHNHVSDDTDLCFFIFFLNNSLQNGVSASSFCIFHVLLSDIHFFCRWCVFFSVH